ncbi:MAG: hypothetical protein Q9227_003577 [Pyrenula ochraceoflavens]
MLNQESLESRAKANTHLRRMFEIDNAFTTTDLTYKQQFVDNVKHLLRTDESGWHTFADTAQVAFDGTLELSPDIVIYENKIPLVSLVQSVVFHGASQTVLPDLLSDKEKLETELRHVIKDMDNMKHVSPRINPLNLILPSYEAIWGVVLRLAIEVLYRSHPQSAVWQETLITFVQSPSPASFKSSSSGDGRMTVKAIVNEGLRLYPPTRRIYRRHPFRDDWKIAADVEHLHRDPDIWGNDAAVFKPSRWLGSDGGEARKGFDAFMPFGYGPLACPARHESGPLMIGILVGVLVKNLREKEIQVTAMNKQSRIAKREPLRLGRESYSGLVFQIPMSVD